MADADATELQGDGKALGGHPEEEEEGANKTRLDEANPPKTRLDEATDAKKPNRHFPIRSKSPSRTRRSLPVLQPRSVSRISGDGFSR